MGFTLQVPRSDRRTRPRRAKSKLTKGFLISASFAGVACAAAIAAVAAPEHAISDLQQSARHSFTQAIIAVGFGIDQVSLTGQRYTLDSDVFDALDLGNVTTFAALDTAAALKRIERLAWVDTAQITRVFPGMLNVQIKERTPAAIWTRGDKTYLIDVTGRTLGPVAAQNGWNLPRISGEGANVEAPLLLTAITRHKDIASHFSHAERVAERRWTVVLNNATRIELGADREVEGMDHVASNALLRRAVAEGNTSIDVRTAGRAILRALPAGTTRTPVVQQP